MTMERTASELLRNWHQDDLDEEHLRLAEEECAGQLALGEALRDEGMQRTTEAADEQDVRVIDQAIDDLNRKREPWSANDLRRLLPEVRQPLIGARVRAKAMRKEMRRVGYEPSTLPSTHSHVIAQWLGAQS